MKSIHLVASLLLSVVTVAPTSAQAGQQPRLMRMSLPGLLNAKLPPAIPASVSHAVKQPDSFVVFDAPGAGTASGQGTINYDTNNSGVSTGTYIDGSGNNHGFVRAAEGTIATFDVDGSLSQTFPDWMNNKGTVVGFYFNANVGVTDGFLRKPSGKIITFDALGGSSSYTLCNSISDTGVVVGSYGDGTHDHSFMRARDGTITTFDPPDAVGSFAFDINRSGTITGPYYDANVAYHGYIRAPGGSLTEFDVSGAGTGFGQGTYAEGINR